jgi:hypothetical protein
MNRMQANIATWRRSHPKQAPLPHPRAAEARQPNGMVCPACLRFGREDCLAHRSVSDNPKENTST